MLRGVGWGAAHGPHGPAEDAVNDRGAVRETGRLLLVAAAAVAAPAAQRGMRFIASACGFLGFLFRLGPLAASELAHRLWKRMEHGGLFRGHDDGPVVSGLQPGVRHGHRRVAQHAVPSLVALAASEAGRRVRNADAVPAAQRRLRIVAAAEVGNAVREPEAPGALVVAQPVADDAAEGLVRIRDVDGRRVGVLEHRFADHLLHGPRRHPEVAQELPRVDGVALEARGDNLVNHVGGRVIAAGLVAPVLGSRRAEGLAPRLPAHGPRAAPARDVLELGVGNVDVSIREALRLLEGNVLRLLQGLALVRVRLEVHNDRFIPVPLVPPPLMDRIRLLR